MLSTLRFIYTVAKLANLRMRQPRQVLALQQRQFRQMLLFAREHSPFYHRRFRGLDLERCPPTDIPPLPKAEMMEHFDDVVTDPHISRAGVERFVADISNLGRYYLGKYAVCHTSGSQGQPSLIVQDRPSMMLTFAAQIARAHNLPKRWTTFLKHLWNPDRMALVTLRPGFYPSGAAFAYMPESMQRFTKILRLSQLDAVADNVAKLNDFQPHILTAYASVLEMLAREEREGRLRLRASGVLRQLNNISEPLSPQSREFIESVFGVHVTDNYSLGECMVLSIGCNQFAGSHLNADLAFIEVVDDHNRPVPNGTPGSKLLLTNLYNRVQPFIRYEITDVVTLASRRCPCGSNLPLIESIQGRSKDQFFIRIAGGYKEIPPYIFIIPLMQCLDMAEYQVVQVERNRFELRMAPLPGRTLDPEPIRRGALELLERERLTGLIDFDVRVVPELKPDAQSGKMKRMQSLVGRPAELEASVEEGATGFARNGDANVARPPSTHAPPG